MQNLMEQARECGRVTACYVIEFQHFQVFHRCRLSLLADFEDEGEEEQCINLCLRE